MTHLNVKDSIFRIDVVQCIYYKIGGRIPVIGEDGRAGYGARLRLSLTLISWSRKWRGFESHSSQHFYFWGLENKIEQPFYFSLQNLVLIRVLTGRPPQFACKTEATPP